MLALLLSVLVLVVIPTAVAQDYLLYQPTAGSTGSHIAALGKSYATVTATQFATMKVTDFQRYKAVIFGDPGCSQNPSLLPSTNLNNLFAAVNGNVMVVGTDELVHPSPGGVPLLRSGLAFVAAEAGKTGLYVSLSCYYHGRPLTPVPFLAPLTSAGVSFKATGVGCFNNAHIVAFSPAINGLNDGILSGWSCSVHQAFSTYPPEFVPLVIARGASGPGVQSFADGSNGIPYIMVRGRTVSPINCGDGKIESPEECDGGAGCEKCKCAAGYTKNTPLTAGCKMINYCDNPGYSGKPENTLSCTPKVGARVITCKDGFYPSTHSTGDNSPTVELKGMTAFGGCFLLNPCTAYGNSGKDANFDRCEPGVNQRRIFCDPGYRAIGGANSTSPDVLLIGDAPFLGCALIDNCKEYGFSGNSANTYECVNGVNTRTIECDPGYYAVSPNIDSIVLTGAAKFAGCTLIDNCAVYGWEKDPNVASCTNMVDARKITCKDGFWAQGKSDNGATTNVTQYADAIPWIILESTAHFKGCSPICGNGKPDPKNGEQCDGGSQCTKCKCNLGYESTVPISTACKQSDFCKLYGWSNDLRVKGCVNGVNQRTITCQAGFYAQSSVPGTNATQASGAKDSITLIGDAPFVGCKEINNCKQYGWGTDKNVIDCKTTINKRTITCGPGYYAQSSDHNSTQFLKGIPTVTIVGSAPFLGCREIDNCLLYGFNKDPNVRSCVSTVNKRTVTCMAGYIVQTGTKKGQGSPSITLVASEPFPKCTPACGDGRIIGGEGCDDGNIIDGDGCGSECTVEAGFTCGDSSNAGKACCTILDTRLGAAGLTDALGCWNGFWVSIIPGSNKIVFADMEDTFELTGDMKLCGDIVIGGTRSTGLELSHEDRPRNMIVTGPAHIYGTVTINRGGSLWFDPNRNSSLTIWPDCREAEGAVGVEENQFTMLPGSGLAIEKADWLLEDLLSAGAFVRLMKGCAELDGDFWFFAHNIPSKSNAFPLISTVEESDLNCISHFQNVAWDLPGSTCSNLETFISNEQVENAEKYGTVSMYAVTNFKHLCNWQIGLLSMGTFFTVAIVGGVAAVLGTGAMSGGVGGGAVADYVAL